MFGIFRKVRMRIASTVESIFIPTNKVGTVEAFYGTGKNPDGSPKYLLVRFDDFHNDINFCIRVEMLEDAEEQVRREAASAQYWGFDAVTMATLSMSSG